MLIGICGASGSGKSTLAKLVAKTLDVPSVIIRQDNYYFDHSDLNFEERCKLNYDSPDIFDHDELLSDIIKLKNGERITVKDYDYVQHRRCDPINEFIEPAPAIICEGIHMLYDERLRDQMDMKIYIQVDQEICLMRRIQRDMRDRGRDLDSIIWQYKTSVHPMYMKYIRTYAEYADLIIPQGGKNPVISAMISAYIEKVLTQEK